MKKLQYTPEQAHTLLTTLKSVAYASGPESYQDDESETLKAMAQDVFGHAVDVESLSTACPENWEAALASPDMTEQFFVLAGTLVMVPIKVSHARVVRVRDMAESVGHQAILPSLQSLADYATGKSSRGQRTLFGRILKAFYQMSMLSLMWKLCLNKFGLGVDKALVQRYEALRQCPENSLGQAILHYYEDNGFSFPSTKGGFPKEIICAHDLFHILSGYDTSIQGEMLLTGFMGGVVEQCHLDTIALVMLQFQNGFKVDPPAPVMTGQYQPKSFWRAFSRGLLAKSEITEQNWNFWPMVDWPLEKALAHLNIPLTDRMIQIGARWHIEGKRPDARGK